MVENARPRDEKYEALVVENEPSLPTHVLLSEKQPAESAIPLLNVDVAPPPCKSAPLLSTVRKFVIVLPLVDATRKTAVFPTSALARIVSFADGVDDPTPRFPRTVWRITFPTRPTPLGANPPLIQTSPPLPELVRLEPASPAVICISPPADVEVPLPAIMLIGPPLPLDVADPDCNATYPANCGEVPA